MTVFKIVFASYLLLTLLQYTEGYEMQTIDLGRAEHCNRNTPYRINKSIVYKLVTRSTSTPFVDCAIQFQHEVSGSFLCVSQDLEFTKVMNPNYELVVSSSECHRLTTSSVERSRGNTLYNSTIDGSEFGQTNAVEACCSGDKLNVTLTRKADTTPAGKPLRVNDVMSTLVVKDMDSPLRYAYFSNPYCFTRNWTHDISNDLSYSVHLHDSLFSVFNRPKVEPGQFSSFVGYLPATCEILVVKKKFSGICLAYIPRGMPDCSSNWRFEVRIPVEPDALHSFRCRDQNSTYVHAWCEEYPGNRTSLIIALKRDTNTVDFSKATPERPEQFQLILGQVCDSTTPSEFLTHVRKWKKEVEKIMEFLYIDPGNKSLESDEVSRSHWNEADLHFEAHIEPGFNNGSQTNISAPTEVQGIHKAYIVWIIYMVGTFVLLLCSCITFRFALGSPESARERRRLIHLAEMTSTRGDTSATPAGRTLST